MTHNSPPPPNPSERVVLTAVGDVEETADSVFFAAHFKAGLFGKPVRRSFWGKPQPDGSALWERASPDDLRPMVGSEVTGHVFVEPVDHAPKEVVLKATGEVVTLTTTMTVRFSDESPAQVRRRYGLPPEEEPVPVVPPGFHLVGGDGQP